MESQSAQAQSSPLPTWVQKLNLTQEDLETLAKRDPKASLDERDQIIYDAVLDFSNKHEISFSLCSAHALDLYVEKKITAADVEEHLEKKFDAVLKDGNPSGSERKLPKKCKTIMLVGSTGDGKSTLTNHLCGKEVVEIEHSARSQTVGAKLFVSEVCDLNIIDTEGIDGTDTRQTNKQLMEKLLLQIVYCLEMGASLDAIIIMWCPLKNGRSGLLKTVKCLKEAFGDEVVDSCIFMVQGNWRPYAKPLNLTEAIDVTKKEMNKEYPQIPIIEYDGRGSDEYRKKELPNLKASIESVKPYRKEYFEEKRRQEFMNMAAAFKFKMPAKAEGENSEERKEMNGSFSKKFQENMFDASNQREKIVNERKHFWDDAAAEKGLKIVGKIGMVVFQAFLPALFTFLFEAVKVGCLCAL